MIDSIKLQIPLTSVQFLELKDKDISNTKRTKAFSHYSVINYDQQLLYGESAYAVRFTASDYRVIPRANLEFSVPKYQWGHNIFLFYPIDLPLILEGIRMQFLDQYELELPETDTWKVMKLDLCYTWKLPSQELAETILESIKKLDFPRKETVVYQTSVIYRGSSYSFKFYLKYNEFIAKDYKDIKQYTPNKAEYLKELSKGCLRVELSARSSKVKTMFRKTKVTYKDLLDEQKLTQMLLSHLQQLLKTKTIKSVEWNEATNLINDKYKDSKAKILCMFARLYWGGADTKQYLKSLYNNSQVTRNRNDIVKAGISTVANSPFQFDLTIPHELVVNQGNDGAAPAAAAAVKEKSLLDKPDPAQQKLF